jgi:hypothetical protein
MTCDTVNWPMAAVLIAMIAAIASFLISCVRRM